MLVMDRACSETNFPMCEHITDQICKNASRTFIFNKVKIASPTTVILLAVVVVSTLRMIGHVKALCSSVGRREMITFFYLYLGSIVIEAILVGSNDSIVKPSRLFLTTVQITLYSSAFFSLFVGSLTTNIFIGAFGLRAITILKAATAIYSGSMGTMVFLALSTKNDQLLSIPFFALNILFFLLYIVVQLKRLRKIDGEVWAYGTLSISLLCFVLSNAIVFAGSELIALHTDRYFDNLFFYHFFILCTFIMIHKYWLSVYDYEVESLQLEV